MRKFKKGDKIIRISPAIINPNLMKFGEIYTFEEYLQGSPNKLRVKEITTSYFDTDKFKLTNSEIIKKRLGIK